jgi:hypothetical protein
MTPKIATCCYCGTRAALMLDSERHELTCSSCGAPLRNLKRMPVDVFGPIEDGRTPRTRKKSPPPPSYKSEGWGKTKPRKRKKSILTMALKEAFDAIEDIFD